jgi:triphosphatase
VGLYDFALQLAEHVPVQVSIVSKAQKGVRLKYGQIEFPKKPLNTTNEIELAAYWFEVWLVYWEAMYFMKDEALMQPLRHSMSQLKVCLPREMAHILDSLDNELEQRLLEEESLLLGSLAGMKSVGLAMLRVGQWLNRQAF